jgi:hypothetical protein
MGELHREDFIEMLKRGDTLEYIAYCYGVKVESLRRRFYRMPSDVQGRIRAKRELMGLGVYE